MAAILPENERSHRGGVGVAVLLLLLRELDSTIPCGLPTALRHQRSTGAGGRGLAGLPSFQRSRAIGCASFLSGHGLR